MKSAYELAMERLEKDDPQSTTPLTEDQKAALADIDARYKARVAEKEVFLGKRLQEARASRDRTAVEQIEAQLRSEKQRLEEECEAKKNKIRAGEKPE